MLGFQLILMNSSHLMRLKSIIILTIFLIEQIGFLLASILMRAFLEPTENIEKGSTPWLKTPWTEK